ncbi:RDD family protein [Psychrosphaera sp.]|nr:RDD family protein [Psychrosphaera sp.]
METNNRASFFKRLAAMVYDWLAVIALSMLVTIVNLVMVSYGADYGLFDLSNYSDPSEYLNAQTWFQIELLLWVWFFYAWFWHDGGQTIGMRAWRLKLQRLDGKPLELSRSFKRAAFSLLGLGNVLVLIGFKEKLSLQDRLTKTEMIVLTKEQNKQIYLRGVEDPNEP